MAMVSRIWSTNQGVVTAPVVSTTSTLNAGVENTFPSVAATLPSDPTVSTTTSGPIVAAAGETKFGVLQQVGSAAGSEFDVAPIAATAGRRPVAFGVHVILRTQLAVGSGIIAIRSKQDLLRGRAHSLQRALDGQTITGVELH